MKNSSILIIVVGMVLSLPVHAKGTCDQPALFFEQQLPNLDELVFKKEREDIWIPKSSYFELINYHLMSNLCGERWVLITVKNISQGHATIKGENIIAVMANGFRREAKIERRIEGGKIETFPVSFGISKIPIIKILMEQK